MSLTPEEDVEFDLLSSLLFLLVILVFDYSGRKQPDSLVFLRDWHVTLHLFVFSAEVTLSFDVLM